MGNKVPDAPSVRVRSFELPYVAGIIDGEGWIGFFENRRLDRIYLRVSVSNTNLQLLLQFRDQFGGYVGTKGSSDGVRKQQYQWILQTHQAAHFVESIYPWLFVKRKQAMLALKFYEIGAPSRSESTRNFQSVMGQLNKRGA